MFEIDFTYTLLLVGLVVGAWWFLFRETKPPIKPIKPFKPINATPSSETVKTNGKSPAAQRAKKIVEVPADTKGKVKIFYGTQTGTAEEFAHKLEKEARRYHIFAEVVDMEAYDPNELKNETLPGIVVISTQGEGEPPDNAKIWFRWLGTEKSDNILQNFKFSVFGLGNKTYEHYNAMGRIFDKRFLEMGGSNFFPRGEGDDDCSMDEDFNKWKKSMWPALCKFLGISADASTEEEKFVPRFKMVQCPPSAAGKFSVRGGLKKANADGTPIYDLKNPYLATITVNRELHGDSSDRSCRHVELEIGNNIQYSAGDHLGVYPENESALVEELAARLGADLDTVISLIPINSTLPTTLTTDEELHEAAKDSFVGPSTLRQILTHAIDITAQPRKDVLKAFSEYTSNPQEKAKLLQLSKDGDPADEYSKFIKKDQRTVLEVLQYFPNVRPPLAHFLEMVPRLQARYYSISSSPNAHPGYVHITSVVVRFNTPTGRKHNGVCSTWLSQIPIGTKVPVFVRESHFKLPPTPAPVIMVGPGTGLAPFRGFLQELQHRKTKKGEDDWESVLFFGCRHRSHDYIYEEELNAFEGDHTLSHLHVAFSREQDQKVYVQDKLADHTLREKLWHFLNDKKGYFYVCGDARHMAKAVHQTLIKVVKEGGNMSEEQATAYVEDLQKSGRYLTDVWF